MNKIVVILCLLAGWKAMAQPDASRKVSQPVASVSVPDPVRRENDILTCQQYQYGIYKAFEEFRRNAPSITQEFVFNKTSSDPNKPFLEAEKDQLQLVNPRGKTSRVLDKVWGFCDSTGVYIYFEDIYQLGKRYNKLAHIGRYCYFVDEYDMKKKPTGSSTASQGENVHIRLEYVLNINSGDVYEFTVTSLRQILSKDPELLRQFEKEENPNAVKYQYLVQFNQRNPHSVKPLKQ